jgi:ankyrin repeat protein
MSLLLEQKANVLAVDQNQNTPLHLAVYTDPASVAVVRLLLGYSANVNAKNANGDTPLHLLAGARYHTKDDILQLLLDRGGDMTIPNVRHSLTHSLTSSI